jgi:histidine triad (HIT) family protein
MPKEDCIFCRIAKKELAASIICEDGDILAFDDVRPKAPVHVVVIPKKHIEKVSDLSDADSGLAAGMILAANRAAKKKGISQSGYRLVINCGRDAGQEIFHLHMHMLGGRNMAWPPGRAEQERD